MKKQLTTLIFILLISTLASAQNVGIGTTTPAALLDVAGDAWINFLTIGRGGSNIADNTALGFRALPFNVTGTRNVGIGYLSLFNNNSGSKNVATGASTLQSNTTGSFNSAFGDNVLNQNTTGVFNSGMGLNALFFNTTGYENTAMGSHAGETNVIGIHNTFIGTFANSISGDLENASAIGSHSLVGASNAMVLGGIFGVNGATANTNVGIGTTTPQARLEVAADILVNGLTVGRGGGNITQNTALGGYCLSSNTTGNLNVAVGMWALLNNTTGANNVANGSNSLVNNTTGASNVANGSYSLFNNTTGNYNVSMGQAAMYQNTSGLANVAIGLNTLFSNTTGIENTVVGVNAGTNNTVGTSNMFIGANTNPSGGNLSNATAIGNRAYVSANNSMVLGSINGVNNANANTNVGIGTTAPQARLDVAADILVNNLTIGRGAGNIVDNTVIGYNSMFSNTTGVRNVAISSWALHDNITGSSNVAIGASSLENNISGFYNVSIGDNAMRDNTYGSGNIAIGLNALISNTSGRDNTVIGINAGTNNTEGTSNMFIGANTNPSDGNLSNATAIGNRAYVSANNSMVLGSIIGVNNAIANTKVGIGTTAPQARLDVAADILVNNLTIGRGSGNIADNTALGSGCLALNTTGNRNVAIGLQALFKNTTGTYNVAAGSFTLYNNTEGYSNSAFGDDALSGNTTGNQNVAIGYNAMNTNSGGEANVAIGVNALAVNTTGTNNTVVGVNAGTNNTVGTSNMFIGANTNPSVGNLSNATAIGDHAYVAADNSMVLGSIEGVNSASANTKVGIGTTIPTASLDVVGTFNATAWKTASMGANGNGYAEMGGVLLQWGMASYSSNIEVTITFPKVFANVFSVTATVDAGDNTGTGVNVPVKVLNIGNNTFQIAGTTAFSGDNVTKIRWMAVGN